MRLFPVFAVATLAGMFGAFTRSARGQAISDCAECHSSTTLSAESVHHSLGCTDCHQGITLDQIERDPAAPHGKNRQQIQCGECHGDEVAMYVKHGRLAVGKDADLPRCWNCHGKHDVLPSSDPRSAVHPTKLPQTCRACHTDVDLVKRHSILRDKPLKMYERSVHGHAVQSGVRGAASCTDCHAASDETGWRTAHRILSPVDPESTTHRFNVPDTCGNCHQSITKDYWEGTHGQYVKRRSPDAPVCTHCHGEHGIVSPRDRLSPVSAARVAEETCTPCHESALLNEKYGLPGGLGSYIDSYHGLKSKAGDITVANCASCHGSHRILPSTDPQSSIHPGNLQNTCGECHPGISAQLAQTKIHANGTALAAGWPEFFRELYLVIIFVTIGFMVLHNAGDWLRHVKKMNAAAFVQRLSPSEVAQHWMLMVSFTVLVITGFSLRFSKAGWVKWLFGWQGGFEARGIIHRVAAVVMIVGAVWHVFCLFTLRGRHWFRDMVAARADLRHFRQNVAYFLGLRREGPRFGRFSYIEKLEYWALAWGTMIMTVTGAFLWFDNYFTESWGLPNVVLDVMLVIHYYEAWLAFLAIVVWHIYGTALKPGVYPMNPAWLSGKMPKDMYAEEHPEGPPLAARIGRVRYEDEASTQTTSEPGQLPTRETITPELSTTQQGDGRVAPTMDSQAPPRSPT